MFKKQPRKKSLAIATYQSVFLKFTTLFLVWLITIGLVFIHYRIPENRFHLVHQVITIAEKLNFYQTAKYLDKTFAINNNDNFFIMFEIFILFLTALLWLISFYCLPALLTVINYFLVIGHGFILGSFYVILDSPIFLMFLFVIPLSVTILVLGLITYLHRIKKMFTINDQVKQNFIILFTLVFVLGVSIQVFLFLEQFSFGKLTILMLVISLLLSILEFILAAFMWALALEELDRYMEQKLPKKYESLLVALMYGSFIAMFFAIVKIIELILLSLIVIKKR